MDMMACVMPRVEGRFLESSRPGRLNEVKLSQKQKGLAEQGYYLVNTRFPETKYSRGTVPFRPSVHDFGNFGRREGR